MAAKLKIKAEHVESEIHYGHDGHSHKVVLKTASQDELELLKKTGDFDYLFEKTEK